MSASAGPEGTGGELEFVEFRERNSLQYLVIMTAITIVLVLGFHLLDLILFPGSRSELLLYRLSVCAGLMMNIALLRFFPASRLRTKAHIYAGFYLLALHLTVLSHLSGGIFSPHWVGTMFVLMFWMTLVPFSLGEIALHGMMFIFQYSAILYFLDDGRVEWKQVVVCNFFLFGAYAIGLAVAFFNNRNAGAVYEAQSSLSLAQKKSEELLTHMLPTAITERLKDKRHVIAESHEDVTILFADIVNFTSISRELLPEALVHVLNEVFSEFDALARTFRLEKIKTIGDAYMVIGGAPEALEDHTERVVSMAVEMRKRMMDFSSCRGCEMKLRIGIHAGPVVAGVIGTTKYAYDLWGDTVNTASRMESQGIAGSIQVTEEVFRRVQHKFSFTKRGTIFVKGRGPMETYILADHGGRSMEHSGPGNHCRANAGHLTVP